MAIAESAVPLQYSLPHGHLPCRLRGYQERERQPVLTAQDDKLPGAAAIAGIFCVLR